MASFLISLAVVLVAWVQLPLQAELERDAESWLALGRQAEAAGEVEEALQIWMEARTELEIPSLEIAVEYLRLATEYQLRDYYHMATSMYIWGVSDVEMTDSNLTALESELTRLEPLVGEETYNRWTGLLKERDPLLLEELWGFWQSITPLPGRSYNPRLLEHWERIAYVQQHFKRSDEPPYGTDVRGRYYVKYGEPDRKDRDFFPLTESDVRRVINPDLARIVTDILYRQTHTPHHYEYWIYDAPADSMTYNLVLLFGEKSAGGFGRLDTLEDLLPNRLFGSHRDYFGLAAIAILEIYYEYLANRDPYFWEMYNEVLIRKRSELPDNLASQMIRFQNQVTTRRNLQAAPGHISTEERNTPQIPLDVYQYRLLDEQNRPVLLSFVESRPTVAFVLDRTSREPSGDEELVESYTLMHGLQLSDEHRRTISQTQHQPALIIDTIEDSPTTSVFTVPFISTETSQLFYAELIHPLHSSESRFGGLLPDEVRGIGKLEIDQPEHFEPDQRLFLGDLIMGYQYRSEPLEGVLFPFVISNRREIPVGENLVVHFELYHLLLNNDGIANFEIEYDIRPISKILFWDRIENRDDLSITLSFQHDTPRFVESLEIETRILEPGVYELIWTARDLNTGEETEKDIRFEIVSGE